MNYLDEIQNDLYMADQILKKAFFNLSPLYKEEFGEHQDVLVSMFTTLHSTSESILILLLNGGIFDADVLLRTVMEGTIKYCYLMTGTVEEHLQKYNEFKIELTNIDKMEDHKKALSAIEILKRFSNNSTKPFEAYLLTDEEFEKLHKQYPRSVKSDLKRKWGYASLLRKLAENNAEYEAQLGTLITYAATSHLCHYDWTGVYTRELQIIGANDDAAELITIGHAYRIMSNVLSMEVFRVLEYMRGNNYSNSEIIETMQEIFDLISELDRKNNLIVE